MVRWRARRGRRKRRGRREWRCGRWLRSLAACLSSRKHCLVFLRTVLGYADQARVRVLRRATRNWMKYRWQGRDVCHLSAELCQSLLGQRSPRDCLEWHFRLDEAAAEHTIWQQVSRLYIKLFCPHRSRSWPWPTTYLFCHTLHCGTPPTGGLPGGRTGGWRRMCAWPCHPVLCLLLGRRSLTCSRTIQDSRRPLKILLLLLLYSTPPSSQKEAIVKGGGGGGGGKEAILSMEHGERGVLREYKKGKRNCYTELKLSVC